jgi:hypothetical protein
MVFDGHEACVKIKESNVLYGGVFSFGFIWDVGRYPSHHGFGVSRFGECLVTIGRDASGWDIMLAFDSGLAGERCVSALRY